ncbi:hypothetical protein ACLB2K_029388 [Fragaria x ananassa]
MLLSLRSYYHVQKSSGSNQLQLKNVIHPHYLDQKSSCYCCLLALTPNEGLDLQDRREKFLHIDGDDVNEVLLGDGGGGGRCCLFHQRRPANSDYHSPNHHHRNTASFSFTSSYPPFRLASPPSQIETKNPKPQIDFSGRFLFLRRDFLHLKGFLATCVFEVFDVSSSGECVAHRRCAVAPWRDLGAAVGVWDWSSGSCSQWRTLVDLQIRLQKPARQRLTSLDRQLGALFVGTRMARAYWRFWADSGKSPESGEHFRLVDRFRQEKFFRQKL